jgi:hypothetical protein
MRGTALASLLLAGACSTSVELDESVQQVADPAPVFSISSTSFSNVIGGTAINFCGQAGYTACAAPPVDQVRWGDPANPPEQSGLGFDAATSHVLSYNTAFALGQLTHFNFPTYSGTWASGVTLNLQLRVDPSTGGPALFDAPISIPFTVDETPNDPDTTCTYPSVSPCADKISFGTSTFQLGNATATTAYELSIQGFIDPTSGLPTSGLISEERMSTSAILVAKLSETCINADVDTVCDEVDNCVGIANADQADSDQDGSGDACDVCPNSATNEQDDSGNCVSDPCDCDGAWANHGAYVSCVAHETTRLVREGKMSHKERGDAVSAAGQSSCGK